MPPLPLLLLDASMYALRGNGTFHTRSIRETRMEANGMPLAVSTSVLRRIARRSEIRAASEAVQRVWWNRALAIVSRREQFAASASDGRGWCSERPRLHEDARPVAARPEQEGKKHEVEEVLRARGARDALDSRREGGHVVHRHAISM